MQIHLPQIVKMECSDVTMNSVSIKHCYVMGGIIAKIGLMRDFVVSDLQVVSHLFILPYVCFNWLNCCSYLIGNLNTALKLYKNFDYMVAHWLCVVLMLTIWWRWVILNNLIWDTKVAVRTLYCRIVFISYVFSCFQEKTFVPVT